MAEPKRSPKDGRPPLNGAESMRPRQTHLYEYQHDWLKQQGGSAYLRGLIDAEIEKAKGEAKK